MKRLLLCLSTILLFHFSYGQFNYFAANGINTAGTYTDLGTNGSAITTLLGSYDDDNSAPQNIGFNFLFNGTTFTQFVLNTNGSIKLGAVAPPANMYDALNSTEANLIYPLNLDLEGGNNPEYRVYTTGTAPNRVCTIQYKHVSDYYQAPATAPQFADMNFQIKLFETTNNIEFVYGSFVAGGAAAALKLSEVGLKGNTAANSVNVTKSSADTWSSAVFIDGTYTLTAHNIRNTVLPPVGTTYRFVNSLPVDAGVSNLYTLGKIPLGYGAPHVVRALIRNIGSNILSNLPVTLTVSGANSFTNTQTIASLAPGESVVVSFSAYTPGATGTNSVVVNVAPDDNNANNSVVSSQDVTASTYSFADNSSVAGSVGYNNGAGLILNKYTVAGNAYVTYVNVFISNAASNTGNTVYGIITNGAGTILGQSANYLITAADLGKYKSFSILTPPAINNSDVYVGLAQTTNATTGYFPLSTQTESPGRSGAYYILPGLTGGVAPSENSTLGRFMIEAVVSASPLPIGLTSFTGKLQNNTAFLNWITGYEINSDKFVVERSLAGSATWENRGTVAVIGNGAVNSYTFTDAGLTTGRWLYRLKIIDMDGRFSYSQVVVLQLSGKLAFALSQNYPNPVAGITMIQYELGKDANVSFELMSFDGKRLMVQQKGKQVKGAYNIQVDAQSLMLAPGKYIYRLSVEDALTGEVIQLTKNMQVIR